MKMTHIYSVVNRSGCSLRSVMISKQGVLQRCKYSMNAGEGPNSYVQNSSYQRGVIDVAKSIIEEEIASKLDIKKLSSSIISGFCLADYGCSTGHNSFPAIQFITQAITKKIETSSITSKIPEFFVYFNDNITNDFNTLFKSLPPKRHYHAIGLPGSFHSHLLPKSSLHFAYSSCSLHWLSKVPKAVQDYNKGAIFYSRNRKEICNAYLDQYTKDLGSFLEYRAQELVCGGLMALLIPAVPSFWDPDRDYTFSSYMDLMGSCLMDMAKKGRISETKVDSFNIPYYFTTPEQLKVILERNHHFTIERMEILDNPGKHTYRNMNAQGASYRAAHEGLLGDHFGSEIIDELFDQYVKKRAASQVFFNSENDKSLMILLVLQRKTRSHYNSIYT